MDEDFLEQAGLEQEVPDQEHLEQRDYDKEYSMQVDYGQEYHDSKYYYHDDFDQDDSDYEDIELENYDQESFDQENFDQESFDRKSFDQERFDRKSFDQESFSHAGAGQVISLVVEEKYDGLRIDKYLSDIMTELSRTYIRKLIDDGLILVSGKPVKANLRVKTGLEASILLPEPKEADIAPENISLDIIHEDNDIIIINKPKGMVVHPAAGHISGTLVNALMYHCKDDLSGINGALRPGIVHRIDKDTTGVLVACKNDIAHRFIAEQLKAHSITRKYYAIVYHNLKTESGRIETTIGRHPIDRKKMAVNVKNGKHAITEYRLIENLLNSAYVECTLKTGRTHQIRVHMASINHPLLGDTVYGPSKDPYKLEGQALHAGVLGFIHPSTKEYVEYSAPIPLYFNELLTKLRR